MDDELRKAFAEIKEQIKSMNRSGNGLLLLILILFLNGCFKGCGY